MGSKGRSIFGHILRCCWSHFLSGLAYICSLDIIWEAVRCLLAAETPNIDSATLSPGYFHSSDIGCPYFCARQFIISHKVSIHFWISYAFRLLLILCDCNIAIWRKVQGRSNPASHLQNRAIQNQRLTKTLLFVSIFPLLTWLPLIIVNYFYSLEIVSMSLNTYYIFVIINSSHYFVNPVVYVLRIPEFRQAFGWCCFRRQPVRVINEERPSRHNRDVVMTHPLTLQTQGLNRQLAFEQIVEDTIL